MKVTATTIFACNKKIPGFVQVRAIHEQDMRQSLVGFYPVQQFLDDFLPLPDHIPRSSIPSIDFSNVPITKQEKVAYNPLVCNFICVRGHCLIMFH